VTLTDLAVHAKRNRGFLSLFKFLLLIVKEKRLLELLYGISCFSLYKPSPVIETSDFNLDQISHLVRSLIESKRREQDALILLVRSLTGEKSLSFLFNAYAFFKSGFIVGEYAENSSRLFIMKGDHFEANHFYQDIKGVRHIHSILCDNDLFFISTGDSKKVLDKWGFCNGEIRFIGRVMSTFAGFTGCCTVQNKHYFGTDFSERPNYIYCLENEKKFFLPEPAYTQFFAGMIPVNDRFIFCMNIGMPHSHPNRSISIFDTFNYSYVYCQAYEYYELAHSPWAFCF
jgi:hypothetical protein